MDLIRALRRVHARVERENDAVFRAVIGHGLVRQPGGKNHQLTGTRRHVYMGVLQIGVAKIHVCPTQVVEVRPIKTRHPIGRAEHRMRFSAGRVVHLQTVNARPGTVAVGVDIMVPASVAHLEPQTAQGNL